MDGYNTRCLALNGNKIKHYISELKGDNKFCASSFKVVTLPVFSAWSRLSSRLYACSVKLLHQTTFDEAIFHVCVTIKRQNSCTR
jgi:hypothetical protein